tara:strand:+ start:96 stop:485 length:390 start_codon:yes stop_codon:yes gene_type:complete
MKRLQLPKNKFLKLIINIGLIVGWLYTYVYIDQLLWINKFWYNLTFLIKINNTLIVPIIIILIPIFFITRYIWFEKSRNRIFYGLFSKFQPRIYTTISNADELKKYSELKDQGIITEDEFQAKKKKLLD